jgi:pilus assembly protein FimV
MLRFFFRNSIEASVRKMTTNPVTDSQPRQGLNADDVTSRGLLPRATWQTPVAAAALALVLGFQSQDAHALALGRVNVLSALSEPLRAEIDVPELTADEAATLRTSVANPEAFRAAGLEYNAALRDLQISLQRRANGSAYLRLVSNRPINEPFIDLIIEASWASGRLVRDYTMLFDPPNLRATPPAAVTAPASTTAAAPSEPPVVSSSRAPAASPIAPPATSTARAAKASPKSTTAAPKDGVTVRPGDTANALATRYKPQGISLDQMLVAMLRSSPDAFIGGNINRLKSGAVIDVQSAANNASGVNESEASQTIVAQSKDFNQFRRRLASGAPMAVAAEPNRTATGKVQTNVQEPKSQASAPDKLTLSKGSVAAKAKEEAIAKDKQAKDNAARVAELSKNIQDLNKIGTSTVAKPGQPSPSAPATGTTSLAGPKVAVSTPPTTPATLPVASTPTASKAVTTSVAALTPTVPVMATSSAVATASPTVTSTASASSLTPTVASPSTTTAAAPTPIEPPPKPKAPPPLPPPAPSFMESLMSHPLLLPGAGALLAGLGGLAFWRQRQRKKTTQVDSSFLESRLQPDSFFGASGGQRIDTADSSSNNGPGSSMVYSPSQLDAAGDVDPVAEADVYLAYGRDLQAEEILKEALRTNSSRVAIHAKLMEIYAKRRDVKAFESVAKEAFNLTQGSGPEWEAASALGRDIDAANPLYKAGKSTPAAGLAASVMVGGAAAVAGTSAMATSSFDATGTMPQHPASAVDSDFDIDLDLDFSAGGDALVSAPDDSTVLLRAAPAAPQAPIDLAFHDAPVLPSVDPVKLSVPDMASFASGLSFTPDSGSPVISAPTAPMALKIEPSGPASLEFDMGDLSLDLPSSAASATNAIDAGISGDPMETKLALALEFRDIGDMDGARSLAQEVAAEASGALQARANKMLADLG